MYIFHFAMEFEELGLRGEEEVMAVVLISSFASCSDLNQGVLEITPKYASEAEEKKHFSCFCSVCENVVIKEYSPQKSSQGAVSAEEIWASREAQGLCRACMCLLGDFAET